jgi:signal transduction histidine kinase
MNTSLRILHLEDNPVDAELIHATLAAEGIACEAMRVETRGGFVDAIEGGRFGLILADYNLPAFDGISALAIAREKSPDVPFIFVSGSLGEEAAIETLKSGATDYVLKHRPERLVPSVRRALEEIEARKERKSLEEQVRQSQKMEAIGILAGGIAHDFNNLLTVILGYSEMLLRKFTEDPDTYADIEQIDKAGRRAASLTGQLLAFSRKQVLELKHLDLNLVVADMEKMFRRVLGEDIDLVTILGNDLGIVKADEGQIQQVIMNLAVNARDAMPSGGKLTIETANVDIDQAYARTHENVSGPHVLLEVSDTGCGMDKETQARVFDPFFTTKEQGRGTGLGLSTVYGIIKQSAGHIWLYSEPGHGTTFKIYLPRVEQQAEDIKPSDESAIETPFTGTMLVVEDDPLVRQLLIRALREQHYTVLETSSGEEALRVARDYHDEIHLLLTDLVMPGINGRALAAQIQALRPTIRILFSSGYTSDAITRHGVLDPGVLFFQKPFTPQGLVRKVREALNSPAQRTSNKLEESIHLEAGL